MKFVTDFARDCARDMTVDFAPIVRSNAAHISVFSYVPPPHLDDGLDPPFGDFHIL